MLWSPTGPTVVAGTGAPATLFVPPGSLNLGGVARIINTSDPPAAASFTLGNGTGITNTIAIPLTAGQDIIVAYGPTDTHIVASVVASISITPGIGRP